MQWRKGLLDDVAELVPIAAGATEWRQQHRNPRLVLDDPLEHDVVHIGALIPTIATRDVHDLFVRGLVAVVAPVHMEAGRIERRTCGGEAQPWGGGRCYQALECGHTVCIERLQGTPHGVIMELCRDNTGRNAARGGRIVEESRDEGARVIDTPQAIAHQRFDGCTSREIPHCRVLLGRSIKDLPNAECVAHASDKAAVVQDLATVYRVVGHDHLL